jgi:hypothetical protein
MKKIFVTFCSAVLITAVYLGSQDLITVLSDDGQDHSKQWIYTDVEPNAWFTPYIAELSESGIVEGYPDGSFGAWDPVNRAELAKVIVLLKAELKGHWLKDNILEIALVLATLFGWIYILSAFKKSTEELTRHLIQAQSKDQPLTTKLKTDAKAEQNIEKNLKSNWWA